MRAFDYSADIAENARPPSTGDWLPEGSEMYLQAETEIQRQEATLREINVVLTFPSGCFK